MAEYICPLCGSISPKGNNLPCPVDCDATLQPMPAHGERVEILAGVCKGKVGVVLSYTPQGRVKVKLGSYWYATLLPRKVRRVADG